MDKKDALLGEYKDLDEMLGDGGMRGMRMGGVGQAADPMAAGDAVVEGRADHGGSRTRKMGAVHKPDWKNGEMLPPRTELAHSEVAVRGGAGKRYAIEDEMEGASWTPPKSANSVRQLSVKVAARNAMGRY